MNNIRHNGNNNNYNIYNNPGNRIDNITNINNNINNDITNNAHSILTLSAKRKQNDSKISYKNIINPRIINSKRKYSYREQPYSNRMKNLCYSEIKNNKMNKDNEISEFKAPNETGVKTNIKMFSNKKIINNNLIFKNEENQLTIKNSDNDSSSLEEKDSEYIKETDKKVSRLSLKSNKEIEELIVESNKYNNAPISIDEDKYNLNKIIMK